jgi:hypothetical protein
MRLYITKRLRKEANLEGLTQGNIIMYFLRLLKFWEINLVILSSFGRRNGFQVEKNVLLER